MSWTAVADVVAAACLLLATLLTLVASIGILRFPDVLSRMPSATKPQVLRPAHGPARPGPAAP